MLLPVDFTLTLLSASVSSYTPVATSDPVIFVPKPDITQRPKVPIPTGEGRPASKARPIDSGTTTADADLTFHSLTDLLGRSLEETVNITGADESRTVKPTSVARQPSRTLPDDNTKRCPVCDEIFPSRATEDEIVYHIEICSSSGARQASTVEKDERYDCPICEQKAVATDEGSYHDHLVRCSNANNIQFWPEIAGGHCPIDFCVALLVAPFLCSE